MVKIPCVTNLTHESARHADNRDMNTTRYIPNNSQFGQFYAAWQQGCPVSNFDTVSVIEFASVVESLLDTPAYEADTLLRACRTDLTNELRARAIF